MVGAWSPGPIGINIFTFSPTNKFLEILVLSKVKWTGIVLELEFSLTPNALNVESKDIKSVVEILILLSF